MEWMGLLSFVFLIFYMGYPKKVERLERKVRKIEAQTRGENKMSRMIKDMIGKKCRIKPADMEMFSSATEMVCEIVDVDEEWVKVVYDVKKRGMVTKLVRIDDIKSIEELTE